MGKIHHFLSENSLFQWPFSSSQIVSHYQRVGFHAKSESQMHDSRVALGKASSQQMFVAVLGCIARSSKSRPWCWGWWLLVSPTFAVWVLVPSGNLLHSYGKSPFSMGNPLFLWPFSIAMLNYQRVMLSLIGFAANVRDRRFSWKDPSRSLQSESFIFISSHIPMVSHWGIKPSLTIMNQGH